MSSPLSSRDEPAARPFARRSGSPTLAAAIGLGLCLGLGLLPFAPAPASAEERAARPAKLSFEKWTPDFQVPDPVAISFDELGRAYVTQTQRRKSQDLDIRNNRDWIENDVSFETVAQKQAFYHERLAPERSDQNKKRVQDLNEDGRHDWRDLTVLSERLFRLEDRDGDGQADQREVIAHGFGLHIAYAGHDMHGLIIGPDGRLYWTIGDKGIHVETKEGRVFAYPNQGGMLRCEPDGSDFEVFAHGLRNIQEIAFDAHGNWFGVDNDADTSGEMERFVYLVRGMDVGWRCHYQYRGSDYNPWTREGLWKPWHEGQPAYFVPAIRNYVNGPAGFVFNPGTALSPAYRDHFFLTSAPNGQQWAFQVEPDGASFAMIGDHQIGNGIPLVGLAFAPDGSLFGVDWGGGYPLNEKGAVWRIDDPAHRDSAERQETRRLLEQGTADLALSLLTERLAHPDQRVRLAAQFELARRAGLSEGSDAEEALKDLALQAKAPQQARIHALWGLGQVWRRRESADFTVLAPLASDPDAEIRAQFARVIGDSAKPGHRLPETALLSLLTAEQPARVRLLTCLAVGELGLTAAARLLPDLATALAPDESYLRHGLVYALAHTESAAELATLHESDSAALRLVAALALRRQYAPEVAVFLDDSDPLIAAASARAIHDDRSIPAALPALAAQIATAPADRGEAFLRRAANANLRLGGVDQAKRLATAALRPDLPEAIRLEAIACLLSWPNPARLDRVEGRFRDLGQRDTQPLATALASEVNALLEDPNVTIRERAMTLATGIGIELDGETLLGVIGRRDTGDGLAMSALDALQAQGAPELDEALALAMKAKSPAVRIRAGELLAEVRGSEATEWLAQQLEQSKSLEERQAALRSLAKTGLPAADAVLSTWLDRLAAGEVEPALTLDLLEAAASRAEDVPDIAEALATHEAARPAGDLLAAYAECVEGGDPARGEDLFFNHVAAQCIRCHKVKDGKGSTIGPNLKRVGTDRPPADLLESLVNPQAAIVEGYGTVSLTLKDGNTLAGQLWKEREDRIELKDAEGKKISVPVNQIASRTPPISTMPPMMGILSKRELRDLVAYLASLKESKD